MELEVKDRFDMHDLKSLGDMAKILNNKFINKFVI